ncbi:MAG: serine/threonine-protein kinase [Dermatophilaceae bacterium]
MNLREGTLLGDRYTLTERIAMGGMGEVWAATDAVLGRTVAVKLLHPALSQESDFVDRFRAEARHTAALLHPNIAAVFDYGEDDGTAYLVMELVVGKPLSQIIAERGPLSAQETTAILIQAATALDAAHAAGVIHRDVKPANIMVTPDGTAKLTDFGISRAIDSVPLTQTGQVLGTAQYLSPEQALGQSATASSDIYALGVVGHEMLTGERPFDTGSVVSTALAQINQPPPPLPDTVPPGIRDVITAALAKDPADRPASAAAMAHALGMSGAAFASAAPVTALLPMSADADPPGDAAGAGAGAATIAHAPTQAMPRSTRLMPIHLLPARAPGRRGRRFPTPRTWLLGAAAAVLVIVTSLALSQAGGNGSAPLDTTATTTSATSTSRPKATAVVAPPAITATFPSKGNPGKGNANDGTKKGKQ